MSNQSDLAKSAAGFNGDPLSIDTANNRVGIGTSSPDQTLHVHKGSAGTVASTASSVLTLENSTTAVLQFLSPNTASNQIRFGDPQDNGAGYIDYSHSSSALTFGANGPERMRIDSSGNVRIGNTGGAWPSVDGVILLEEGILQASLNNSASLYLNRGSSNGNIAQFARSGVTVGGISVTTTSTSFNTSSDHRLKENVTDVTDGIARVKQLEPKRFNFIADPDRTVDGFLAHEAQAVVPEAVTGTYNEVDDDGNAVMQGIDQSKLVPLLTAALKESIAKIEALEARVTALEGS
jgi:hypothetical protein